MGLLSAFYALLSWVDVFGSSLWLFTISSCKLAFLWPDVVLVATITVVVWPWLWSLTFRDCFMWLWMFWLTWSTILIFGEDGLFLCLCCPLLSLSPETGCVLFQISQRLVSFSLPWCVCSTSVVPGQFLWSWLNILGYPYYAFVHAVFPWSTLLSFVCLSFPEQCHILFISEILSLEKTPRDFFYLFF